MTVPVIGPVISTTDEVLLDDLLRLAVAAGVEAELRTPESRIPADAPLVVIGVEQLLRSDLVTRVPLVAVGRREPTGAEWQAAVTAGVASVLELPADERELVRWFADAMETGTDSGRVLCCVGGRGGAGASVLAAGLAVTAARQGRRSLLVDLDPVGGGIDLLVGAEDRPGLRWPDLDDAAGRVSAAALHEALPVVAGVAVVAVGRRTTDLMGDAGVVQSVLAAGHRGGDLVVVDLPRSATPARQLAVEMADAVLLVTSADVRACAAAAAMAAELDASDRLALVVRGPAPSGLSEDVAADAVGLPLAATMRSEAGLDRLLDRGGVPAASGRGPLARACRGLLDRYVAPSGRPVGRHRGGRRRASSGLDAA